MPRKRSDGASVRKANKESIRKSSAPTRRNAPSAKLATVKSYGKRAAEEDEDDGEEEDDDEDDLQIFDGKHGNSDDEDEVEVYQQGYKVFSNSKRFYCHHKMFFRTTRKMMNQKAMATMMMMTKMIISMMMKTIY